MPEAHTATESTSDRPASSHDDLYAAVARVIADVLDISPRDIDERTTLLQLGAESLMFVEIVLKLESQYGIRVDRSYGLPNPHTIVDYVKAVRTGLAQKEGHR